MATSQRVVHKVTSQPAFQNRGKSDGFKGRLTSACYRCDKSGHGAYQCKFKSAVCFKCGKKGHIWSVSTRTRGLFRYTHLPFGISSAPGIFQRIMESLLQGILGVIVYLDDILVSAPNEEEHLCRLEQVFDRLEKSGLRAQENKCQFLVSEVSYLGHQIDAERLHSLPSKVQAVVDAPSPRTVQELKAYLGLFTYYGKFMPDLPSLLAPLYMLLRKGSQWHWRGKEDTVLQKSKELLTSLQLLVHFDANLPLVLACDTSAYGVGAVLAHRMPDGSEHPIGFASHTLSPAEQNYSQLEKEGLSCVFGARKFHSYLYGHAFELITDHKPLMALLNEY